MLRRYDQDEQNRRRAEMVEMLRQIVEKLATDEFHLDEGSIEFRIDHTVEVTFRYLDRGLSGVSVESKETPPDR